MEFFSIYFIKIIGYFMQGQYTPENSFFSRPAVDVFQYYGVIQFLASYLP